MRILKTVIPFLLFCFFITACGRKTYKAVYRPPTSYKSTSTSLVKFEKNNSLELVLNKAKANNKLVFIDFYIDRCPPCKLMDKEVFTNKSMGSYLNSSFVNYKVNVSDKHGANVAQLYQVRAYPTLIFTDEHGQELVRHEGGISTSGLQNLARRAQQKLLALGK